MNQFIEDMFHDKGTTHGIRGNKRESCSLVGFKRYKVIYNEKKRRR
ncbi:MAG: hypothetical protein LBJ98_02630 [Endomicrobium sp.]|nr:hypothetical protein [Endomicrobium sp.]